MADVKLTWEAPHTRVSGKPLSPADIAGFMIEQQHDGGEFVKLTDAAADSVERLVTNLDSGSWNFRISCFDRKNRIGAAGTGSIVIEDDTPPGIVLNVTVSISASLATSQG